MSTYTRDVLACLRRCFGSQVWQIRWGWGSDKMNQIEKANVRISNESGMARPLECVFNTMPQALFHRARIEDHEMMHFISSRVDPHGADIPK